MKQFGCLKLGTYIKTAHLPKLLCLGKAKETLGLLFFINNHIVCWGNLLQLCWLDWVQRFGPLDQQLHGDKRSPLSMWVCDNSVCCQDLWRALVPAQQSLSLPCAGLAGWGTQLCHLPQPRWVRAKGQINVQGLWRHSAVPTGAGSCASLKPTHWALTTFCRWAGHSCPVSCRPCAIPAAPRRWDTWGQAWTLAGSLAWVGAGGALPGTELLQLCWAQLPCPPLPQPTVFGQALEGFFLFSLILRPGEHRGSGGGHVRTGTFLVYPCYIFSKTYMNPNIIEPQALHFTQHKFLYSSWSCFKSSSIKMKHKLKVTIICT